MARIFESEIKNGPLAGAQLLRMVRPEEWGDRWCQVEGCDFVRPVPSVWSVQPKGSGFIGWRAACSRAHALIVWGKDLADAG